MSLSGIEFSSIITSQKKRYGSYAKRKRIYEFIVDDETLIKVEVVVRICLVVVDC
jgi:hypothetical protein